MQQVFTNFKDNKSLNNLNLINLRFFINLNVTCVCTTISIN